MPSKIPLTLESARAYQVLRMALGTTDKGLVFTIVLLLVSLGWFGDFWYERFGGWPLAVVFPAVLGWLWLRARRYRDGLQAQIRETSRPPPARGLIVFLSYLRPEHEAALRRALAEHEAGPGDGVHSMDGIHHHPLFKGFSWRMNLEAIHYHERYLSHLFVVPSEQSQAQLDLFERMLDVFWPGRGFELLHGEAVNYRCNIEAVARAVNEAFRSLADRGISTGEVVIDITSGTGIATVAGVTVALAEGRRIQYVEGQPDWTRYRVLQADIQYET